MDMFFLATVDDAGQANSSYKGGEPGFVRVIDDRTIAFPNYDGNGMYLSMGNISANGQVGILFIDFEHQRRIRFNGEATIDADDPLMVEFPEAELLTARGISIRCDWWNALGSLRDWAIRFNHLRTYPVDVGQVTSEMYRVLPINQEDFR
jgi:hypothetical protein